MAKDNLTLEEINEEIEKSVNKLHHFDSNVVFGEGNPKAHLVFVGEAPGEQEDKQKRPFVGRAGQLLDKKIAAMGLKRSDVYITNVVKCRPPKNRKPHVGEIRAFEPFLFQELQTIKPDIIVCLGTVAAQSVLKTKETLGNLRGKFHSYGNAKVLVSYHPAALLRNQELIKPFWDDLQLAIKELESS